MREEIHNDVGNALCSNINALYNNENNYWRNKMYLNKKKKKRMRLHDKGFVKFTWIKENIYAKQ